MKKLILSLAGAAFVAALAINLTLNKADVLAQNKLLLENIEAMTTLETRSEAEKSCTTIDALGWKCTAYHTEHYTNGSSTVSHEFYGMRPKHGNISWHSYVY